MNWLVWETPAGVRHVLPLLDMRTHCTEPTCWCRPEDDEGVWVHNSADGRELFERRERKLS